MLAGPLNQFYKQPLLRDTSIVPFSPSHNYFLLHKQAIGIRPRGISHHSGLLCEHHTIFSYTSLCLLHMHYGGQSNKDTLGAQILRMHRFREQLCHVTGVSLVLDLYSPQSFHNLCHNFLHIAHIKYRKIMFLWSGSPRRKEIKPYLISQVLSQKSTTAEFNYNFLHTETSLMLARFSHVNPVHTSSTHPSDCDLLAQPHYSRSNSIIAGCVPVLTPNTVSSSSQRPQICRSDGVAPLSCRVSTGRVRCSEQYSSCLHPISSTTCAKQTC